MSQSPEGMARKSAEERRALLAELLRRQSEKSTLSIAQERLWFLNQLEPESAANAVQGAFHLSGPLDVEALERALNEIVSRHETLRAVYVARKGKPVQVVLPGMRIALPVQEITGGLAAAVEEAAVVTMHHIVSDGWSLGVLVGELGVLYAAFRDGKPSPLAPLPLQYPDVAVSQRQRLSNAGEQLAYWRTRLGSGDGGAGAAPVLGLPTDRPRPPVQTYRGADCSIVLPGAPSSPTAPAPSSKP